MALKGSEKKTSEKVIISAEAAELAARLVNQKKGEQRRNSILTDKNKIDPNFLKKLKELQIPVGQDQIQSEESEQPELNPSDVNLLDSIEPEPDSIEEGRAARHNSLDDPVAPPPVASSSLSSSSSSSSNSSSSSRIVSLSELLGNFSADDPAIHSGEPRASIQELSSPRSRPKGNFSFAQGVAQSQQPSLQQLAQSNSPQPVVPPAAGKKKNDKRIK